MCSAAPAANSTEVIPAAFSSISPSSSTWDLPLRAITVDTRWGASRYDEEHETESYLLEGAQLTPLAHRVVRSRTDDTTVIGGETVKIFHTRVEGEFRKIAGTQDPGVNDGSVVDEVTLPPVDGSVLLRP